MLYRYNNEYAIINWRFSLEYSGQLTQIWHPRPGTRRSRRPHSHPHPWTPAHPHCLALDRTGVPSPSLCGCLTRQPGTDQLMSTIFLIYLIKLNNLLQLTVNLPTIAPSTHRGQCLKAPYPNDFITWAGCYQGVFTVDGQVWNFCWGPSESSKESSIHDTPYLD